MLYRQLITDALVRRGSHGVEGGQRRTIRAPPCANAAQLQRAADEAVGVHLYAPIGMQLRLDNDDDLLCVHSSNAGLQTRLSWSVIVAALAHNGRLTQRIWHSADWLNITYGRLRLGIRSRWSVSRYQRRVCWVASHLPGAEGSQVQAATDAARRDGAALGRPQRNGCSAQTGR